MRELVFRIDYERGADPIMDVFAEYETLRSRSMACQVSPSAVWRLDRFTGPTEALDRVDDIYATHDRCLDCVIGVHDHPSTIHEVLAGGPTERTVYTFREASVGCASIPCLTCKHVGRGILSESYRRGSVEEWRLLLPDESGIGSLYEDLRANLRDGLSATVAQLSEPSYWVDKAVTVSELSHEQRSAVEAAVTHGYYETPRDVSLQDLADTLDVPRSTLQYRLQQAESWIVTQFVRNSSLGDVALALERHGGEEIGGERPQRSNRR